MTIEYTVPARPPREALEYLEQKELTPSARWFDVYAEEHAHAFTVAKALKKDILQDLHKATTDAIREGKTLKQFQDELQPLLRKKGWWGRVPRDQVPGADDSTDLPETVQLGSPRRLRTIYDTNMRQAYHAGRWNSIQRTKSTFPMLTYRLGPSREHRLDHVQLSGTTLPVDHPFWRTHYPQNGWGCKCWVQRRRRGIEATEVPPTPTREYTNRSTGEVRLVPEGIDPGFEYNVGVARWKNLTDLVGSKFASGAPEVNEPILRSFLDGGLGRAVFRQARAENYAWLPSEVLRSTVEKLGLNENLERELVHLRREGMQRVMSDEYGRFLQGVQDAAQRSGFDLSSLRGCLESDLCCISSPSSRDTVKIMNTHHQVNP